MTTTFHDIINQDRFKFLRVLTDPTIVDTVPVTNVEITETPDYEAYSQNGGLLLTTAMYFKDRQEELIPFIDSLIRVDIKVLGIKTQRFLGQLDPAVIDYANQKGFIIFDIPIEVSLGSLLHQLLNLIWGTRNEEVLFGIDAQKRFSELLINDAPSQIMINELSQLVKSPIILLNPFREIINQSQNLNYPGQYYIDRIFHNRQLIQQAETFVIESYKGPIEVYVLPVEIYRYFPHYLIVLNADKIPYPISTFTLELAGLVLKFTLYKNQKVAESKWQIEANYFKDLLDSSAPTSFPKTLKGAGYIQSEHYQLIHISEKSHVRQAYPTAHMKEQLVLASDWLHTHLEDYFQNAVLIHFVDSRQTYILLQAPVPDLECTLSQLARDLEDTLPIEPVFSISLVQNSWRELSEAYTQANLAYEERRNDQDIALMRYYQNKGVLHLFNQMNERDLTYFCQSVLKDLAGPQTNDQNYSDLKKTLKVYLECQCEITRTAKELFIHRNTVKYRIQRIEELLGYDISTPEHSLNLRIALMLDEQ